MEPVQAEVAEPWAQFRSPYFMGKKVPLRPAERSNVSHIQAVLTRLSHCIVGIACGLHRNPLKRNSRPRRMAVRPPMHKIFRDSLEFRPTGDRGSGAVAEPAFFVRRQQLRQGHSEAALLSLQRRS